ncbi:mitochondrial small ribosomal subunit Rsm22-domain-containing protein [Leucosporidium creatinivorum]|uniref:Mitochondrial small ribosomal subunit Rsm22-domain-containing protein n=1 Tax=Leucosporidium creatinivorum TaxID=106004 RepID=A0A1Y2G2R0_9BASI|nr:mitochondrial small ribosomal subunit Rsm22-domain-containing protein [Leucosporidium creatinivorum]
MLTRSSLAPRSALRRGMKIDALSRLQLDINAAHNSLQESYREPAAPVEKSPEAVRGESLRGDVQLPRDLQEAVDKAILEADDGPALRTHALSLYAHLRETSSILPPPSSYRDRLALTTTYDESTSLAYLAGLMPSVYGATLHALTMARNRLGLVDGGAEEWVPEQVLDFGSGTASAAWAFDEVWPATGKGEQREYVGMEAARSMVELGSSMLGALPQRIVEVEGGQFEGTPKLPATIHQLTLPAHQGTLAKMQISATNLANKRTLAVAAFSLGELSTKEKRKEFVRAMWESGAEVLVLVERGTPGGSRMIVEAREQLLMLGRRSKNWEAELAEVEGPGAPKKGAYVLAPCPHDGACPLHNSTKTYCHFSQRVRSPPFLRHTKHTTRGEDDAKFSYVVIRRGTRPSSGLLQAQPHADLTIAEETLETLLQQAVEEESSELAIETLEPEPATPEGIELAWPRLVAPPLKRSGHVILEVCTASGALERHTIPKSQGRQAYYDARKVAWGDSFPHAPKNGPQPAPAAIASAAQEAAGAKDKFGKGKSKVRSKKAERAEGRDWDRPVKEGRRKKGGNARDGEVQDFELTIGPDGQFKIL